MKRLVATLMALVCSVSVSTAAAQTAPAQGSLEVGLHGSTLGLGASLGFGISDRISARAMFNMFELDYDETESGNEYEGDLDLQSLGLVADWHPVGNGLRLTGGVFLNDNEVSARAEGTLDFNETDYQDARLDVRMDFERLAPYFGVGWASGYGEPGLGFAFDVGLLYQQSPRVSGSGNAGDCSFEVSRSGDASVTGANCLPGLAADLEAEHADLANALDDFRWYPVLSLGLSYRF